MPRTSIYPNGIDGYSQIRIVRDRIDEIIAEDNNALRSAIIKIEQTLGIRPQSTFGTVDARITALEAGAAAISAGKLKVSLNDTTPNFLEQKTVAGRNIFINVLNDGGDEDLEIRTTETLQLPIQTLTPGPVVNLGSIYTKDGYDAYGIPTGITELFYIDDAGAITQITDDGYLATASSLRRIGLYAQTSVPVPNVFGKSYLYSQNIAGITELMYRDSNGQTFNITDDGYLSGVFNNIITSGSATIGTTLNTGSDALIGKDIIVAGDVLGDADGYFQGDLDAVGNLDIDGYAVIDGYAAIGGNVIVAGDIIGSGDGNFQGNLTTDGYLEVDKYVHINEGLYLYEQVADTLTVANNGSLYVKDGYDAYGVPTGITELFYKDSAGSITQITDDGYLNTLNSLRGVGLYAQTSLAAPNVYGKGHLFTYNLGATTELGYRDSQGRMVGLTYDGYLNPLMGDLIVTGDAGVSGNLNVLGQVHFFDDLEVDGYLGLNRQIILNEFPFGFPAPTSGASVLYGKNNGLLTELAHIDRDGNQVQLTQDGLVGLRGREQKNIIYVGGSYPGPIPFGTFDGYDIGTRFGDFTNAINFANLLVSPTNIITIVCFDSSIYNEFIDVPPYINIFAPNATLITPDGVFGIDYAITVQNASKITFGQINPGNNVGAIFRNNAGSFTEDTIIEVDSIRLTGPSTGILNLDSGIEEVVHFKCNKLIVDNNGFGVGSLIAGEGKIILDIGTIYLIGGNSYGITQLDGGIFGKIGEIIGATPGNTAIFVTSSFVNLNINEIYTDTQINLQGGELEAFIGSGSGDTLVIPGSIYNVTYAGKVPPYKIFEVHSNIALSAQDGYEFTLVNAVSGDVRVILPPNETILSGESMIFKKRDSSPNNMIIEGYGGKFIDSAPNITTNVSMTSYSLINDGYQWWII